MYVGKISGYNDPEINVRNRDYSHHKNAEVFLEKAQAVMETSPDSAIMYLDSILIPEKFLKKDKYMEYPEIASAIQKLEEKFAGEGRVLIRPSGTEPLVRVMIEGKDQKAIEDEAKKLANLITKTML